MRCTKGDGCDSMAPFSAPGVSCLSVGFDMITPAFPHRAAYDFPIQSHRLRDISEGALDACLHLFQPADIDVGRLILKERRKDGACLAQLVLNIEFGLPRHAAEREMFGEK